MNPKKTLEKILAGSKNVPFDDLVSLAVAFGFSIDGIRGSHHILSHPACREILNLQEVKGKAIPYQVRQLLKLVDRYGLTLEED